MSNKFNIGVIGHGFIGQALVHGFILHANIKIYDKYKEGLDSFDDVVNGSDIIFLCLPTPMIKETGDYDLSILEETILKVSQMENVKNKVLVTKSTVLPGTNRMFATKYGVNIVSNPEFLTARSNRLDFINASRIVLGGEDKYTGIVKDLYTHRFGNSTNIYTTSWEAAELTKLTANCFFALKVLYFNTIYDVCNEVGVDYNEVKDMVLADGRIGRSHCDVPGHDKFVFNGQVQRGVSGHCFPKDMNAFMNYMRSINVNDSILRSAWDLNLQYRPSKDWENLGPSVVVSKKDSGE